MQQQFPSNIIIPLRKGSPTDDGATSWYAELTLGSDRQELKFGFDTGTAHSWVTSELCKTYSCRLHHRFNMDKSHTYKQLTPANDPKTVSFGPWGDMLVSLGEETLFVDNATTAENYKMYMSQEYKGEQFDTLMWDGAIGIPCTPNLSDTSELAYTILHDRKVEDREIFFNYADSEVQFRAPKEIATECVLQATPPKGYEHLWFLPLHSIFVVEKSVGACVNKSFCIDTGSSRFKGDPIIIQGIIDTITDNGRLEIEIESANPDFKDYPTINLQVGESNFTLMPKHYFEKTDDDFYELAFHPMDNMEGILVAGTQFLEPYNPIFYFDEEMKGSKIGFVNRL